MTDLLRSNASIMRRRFEGKGAIVTGGGSGMEREFCVLLAKSGVANLDVQGAVGLGLQRDILRGRAHRPIIPSLPTESCEVMVGELVAAQL
ncbi:hypothetical protein DIPPA_29126 [Diplonema papillatum]|nr:hypothetical protein DIPPA_29126 [Diplonema papillatum]